MKALYLACQVILNLNQWTCGEPLTEGEVVRLVINYNVIFPYGTSRTMGPMTIYTIYNDPSGYWVGGKRVR